MSRIKKDWVQATSDNVKCGVKIRVNPKIVEPRHAWGSSVTHASIGVVTNVWGVRECYIDFPEHLGW